MLSINMAFNQVTLKSCDKDEYQEDEIILESDDEVSSEGEEEYDDDESESELYTVEEKVTKRFNNKKRETEDLQDELAVENDFMDE